MRSGGLFPLAGSRAWFGVARDSDWLCLPFPRRAVCDSGAPRGPRSTGCVQRPHSRSARFRTLPCGLSVGFPTNRLSRCDRILSRRTSIIMPPEPGNKSFGVHSYLCAANAFASPRPSFCHGERRAGLRSDADRRFNRSRPAGALLLVLFRKTLRASAQSTCTTSLRSKTLANSLATASCTMLMSGASPSTRSSDVTPLSLIPQGTIEPK